MEGALLFMKWKAPADAEPHSSIYLERHSGRKTRNSHCTLKYSLLTEPPRDRESQQPLHP